MERFWFKNDGVSDLRLMDAMWVKIGKDCG